MPHVSLCINIYMGKTPTCFRNFATHLSNENRTNSFFLPQVKYAIIKHFPNYSLPKFWNDLGLGLKLCNSFKTFKMLLKKELNFSAIWFRIKYQETNHTN